MNKIVDIDGSTEEWIDHNDSSLRLWIMEGCETALSESTDTAEVVVLRTKNGLTRFVITGADKIIKALTISMNHFVKNEEYELAARARDCIFNWKKKESNGRTS